MHQLETLIIDSYFPAPAREIEIQLLRAPMLTPATL